ncbi:MAG: hypothetical protein FGF52_05205 [Candidatus Brockarchaeota archaeon]|nr:hypothetical protein [Candidatus Brockarchaeota archaeon]
MTTREKKLPEAKEVSITLGVDEARELLGYIPDNLQKVESKVEEAIKNADFWNFLRDCEYLEAVQADFHLTGLLNPPAWNLYCKHPENRKHRERENYT